MPDNDQRKQSLYFPTELLQEIRAEAERLERPISWIVQTAWKIARAEIRRYPAPLQPEQRDAKSREDS